jgi:DNA damage-binding protein 1
MWRVATAGKATWLAHDDMIGQVSMRSASRRRERLPLCLRKSRRAARSRPFYALKHIGYAHRMKVVSTLHQPSAVLSSLSCKLSADSEFGHLLVARTNRIEVSSIHPEGLKLECSLEIWGRILAIRAVPAQASLFVVYILPAYSYSISQTAGVSNVLALTDHPDPRLILLQYSTGTEPPELTEIWSSSLYDRHARHAEYLNDIIVHPAGRAAVVSCYAGKLKVITLNDGKVNRDFDVMSVSTLMRWCGSN